MTNSQPQAQRQHLRLVTTSPDARSRPVNYVSTVTEVTIHPLGESPVLGDNCTRLRLADEAGGLFFELSQDQGPSISAVRIDPEELPVITQAAATLMQQAAAHNP